MTLLLLVLVQCLSLVLANEEALQTFADGNKRFTADIYRELVKKTDGNFLACPLSAEVALALTQSGADQETGDEIRTALHFPSSTQDVESAFETLLPSIRDVDSVTFHSANKIYIKDSYPIKADFNETAIRVFGASSQNIDFSNNAQAASTINAWVAQQTANKIKNLLDTSSLDQDTVAVLVNALYLQAVWKRQFKGRLTKKSNFFKTPDETVEVDLMEKQEMSQYYESEELEAKFLETLFRGGDVKMVWVLPNEIDGLAKLEERIDDVIACDNFTGENVKIQIPKFKIETSIDFKSILKKLGVNRAFTRPDFSAIAGDEGEIHISNILQKTFISVSEKGVEAAASTGVLFHPKSLMPLYGDVKTFRADHPFLFYIKFNDLVVFVGRVVVPSTKI